MLELRPPVLTRFCTLEVEIGPIRPFGRGRFGERRIIPILGGRVHGPRITGTILGIGADWQTVTHDGLADLDTRYAFETDDGAIVEIVNRGYRHGPPEVIRKLAAGEPVAPESYYMRTYATLESGHPDYLYLNRMVFVGTGARNAGLVQIDLYAVE